MVRWGYTGKKIEEKLRVVPEVSISSLVLITTFKNHAEFLLMNIRLTKLTGLSFKSPVLSSQAVYFSQVILATANKHRNVLKSELSIPSSLYKPK